MNTNEPEPAPATQGENWALNVTLADGKYTVRQHEAGNLFALRHGQPWQELTGNNLVLCLAQEIATLRQQLAQVEKERDEAREQWRMSSVCRELRAENERLRGEIDQLVMERDHFHDERDTLRQWSEQAREAMVKALNQLDDELLTDENLWDCMKRIRALLQSHPAATNLTEEGKP